MGFMKYDDAIVGNEATATIDINGSIEEAFFIKTLEAKMEKNKSEGKTLGKRSTQHKANGWNGTGSMTIYYITSLFRKLAYDYAKTGKDAYFTITVTNEDPASSSGKQTVVLYNCNLDSVVLAKIDIDSEALDEEVDFTFDGFEILDEFDTPNLAI